VIGLSVQIELFGKKSDMTNRLKHRE